MTLDKSGAAEALAEIGQSQKRSASLYSYTLSAPYLFLTGLMWLVADLLFQFTDWGKHWAWIVVSVISLPIFVVVSVFQARQRKPASTKGFDDHFWKAQGIWIISVIFVVGTFVIFAPSNGRYIHSFIGLASGAAYAALGLWMGRRIFAVGVFIAVFSMIGHLFIFEYYTAFMGIVCGGGMMLSALWLRRV